MKTLILGLGNPILSDDGVGLRVAGILENMVNQPEITVAEASAGGLNLLDLIAGFDRVIIIDAIQTRSGQAGQIYRFGPEALEATYNTGSVHDVDFPTALELGRRLGMALPQQITIFAIEVKDVTNFSEKCTPEVEIAVPVCVQKVLDELSEPEFTDSPLSTS